MKKRRRWLWLLLLIPTFVALDFWLFPPFARPAGRVVDRGENAIWLRYKWYFGEYPEAEWAPLAKRLGENGIRDAYFHVRSIQADGQLKYRYLEKARSLNRRMAKLAPGVRRIAWVYAGNPMGQGEVQLGNPEVRKRMVKEAVWLVRSAGLDGVQWDYEICPDNDPNLLKLLEETRAALPQGTFLGAAVPSWYPPPIGGVGWSEEYYREVAQRCDQLAVMAYDTGAVLPRSYVWFISEQVVRITRATARAGSSCKVVMGVPTYDEGLVSHNPRAENLRLALIGVRNGLAGGADLSAWQGVGIFADYTTDEREWATWRDLWAGSP